MSREARLHHVIFNASRRLKPRGAEQDQKRFCAFEKPFLDKVKEHFEWKASLVYTLRALGSCHLLGMVWKITHLAEGALSQIKTGLRPPQTVS